MEIKTKLKKIPNLRYWWKLKKMGATVFFRDDDVDVLDTNITRLIELFTKHNIPLSLEVVPNKLDDKFVGYFSKLQSKNLFDIGQHGFDHKNHAVNGAFRGEFGANRNDREKRTDIRAGRELLKRRFGEYSKAIFIPPWNSMDEETFRILKEEYFTATSCGQTISSRDTNRKKIAKWRRVMNIKKFGMFDLSESVDAIADWDTVPRIKKLDELVDDFEVAKEEFPIVGVMLHDKKMADSDFETLEKFLVYLKEKKIPVKTMGEIVDDLM